MKVDVKTLSNEVSGSAELPDDIFGIEPRKDVIARVVRWQLAKRRSGNHAVKSRSQVSGTGKKPYRQKGTGNARQGCLRAVQFRTGGVVHGPVVRDHGYSLPKKIRRLGLRSALSLKQKEGELIVYKPEEVDGKTKTMAQKLKAFGDDSILFIGKEDQSAFNRSVRNLPKVDVLPVIGLNVYDILRHGRVAISEDCVDALKDRLS